MFKNAECACLNDWEMDENVRVLGALVGGFVTRKGRPGGFKKRCGST